MLNDSPQVQAIRARFRNSFDEKKQIIDTFLSNLEVFQKQGDDGLLGDELESCHAELHKFAGSFGMYGYTEISGKCRAVMKAISNKKNDETITLLSEISVLLGSFDE